MWRKLCRYSKNTVCYKIPVSDLSQDVSGSAHQQGHGCSLGITCIQVCLLSQGSVKSHITNFFYNLYSQLYSLIQGGKLFQGTGVWMMNSL